jgi:hypothetical protein
MLKCEQCKLKRIERVGLFRRKVARCGIHERYVGLKDECSATVPELRWVAEDLTKEADWKTQAAESR